MVWMRAWLIAALVVVPPALPAGAETIFAMGPSGQFYRLESNAAGATLVGVIEGLTVGTGGGEHFEALMVRPAIGELYVYTISTLSIGRFYRVDRATGIGAFVGSRSLPGLDDTPRYGIKLNPVTDILRLVNDAGENRRITVSGSVLTVDTDLTFTPPAVGPIIAIAFDRSFAGTTQTTLYAIDAGAHRLVKIGGINGVPAPDGGVVTSVGPLGVTIDAGTEAGFDISGTTGIAYASLRVGGTTRLYTINLNTGAATLVRDLTSGTFRSIAVVPPRHVLATGAGPGGGPHVRVFDDTGTPRLELLAYPGFAGGVRVALCDVNGDGIQDVVTGPGPGGGPHVKVFDGRTGLPMPGPIGSFFAFDPTFTGGIFVGCTDLNEDGKGDIIVSAGPGGGPHVEIFNGATGAPFSHPLGSFFAYGSGFAGGVFVGGGP